MLEKDLKMACIKDLSMENELRKQLKKQQEEIEKLKKLAKRQKWWNVVFAFREIN